MGRPSITTCSIESQCSSRSERWHPSRCCETSLASTPRVRVRVRVKVRGAGESEGEGEGQGKGELKWKDSQVHTTPYNLDHTTYHTTPHHYRCIILVRLLRPRHDALIPAVYWGGVYGGGEGRVGGKARVARSGVPTTLVVRLGMGLGVPGLRWRLVGVARVGSSDHGVRPCR